MKRGEKFTPALGFDRLTPLYEPLVKRLMPESKFKSRPVYQARLGGQHVLDVVCKTATLTLLLKQTQPGAEDFGLNGDAKIWVARRKAEKELPCLSL